MRHGVSGSDWRHGDDHSEMAKRVREHDWAATSLGPIDTWPIALQTAVSLCLSTDFPVMIGWGPDLLAIYNDGYRELLGRAKHPQALGTPLHQVWPEVWDVLGPMCEKVVTQGRAVSTENHALIIDRDGYPEETYFTLAYSPIFDGAAIGGVLAIVTETTDEVLALRRLQLLSDLNRELIRAEQVTDVAVSTVNVLGGTAPARAIGLYLQVEGEFLPVASTFHDELEPLGPDALAAVAQHGPVLIGGHDKEPRPARYYAMPIGASDDGVHGVLVVRLNPHRAFDDAYRDFLTFVSDAVDRAVQTAYRRSVVVGEFRRISDTLQAAMLKPSSDFVTVAARYLAAKGNLAVGGDWYDVIDLGNERRALVVGDCVGHGLTAATAMAQLRSASHAMLLEGSDPASVLDSLDRFARSIDGADFATVACAVIDRRARTLTYARAGHLPPLLVTADGVQWLDEATGLPLAVADKRRVSATVSIHPGDVIVMCSDGLVERRGENIDVGLKRLADAVVGRRDQPVQAIAAAVIRDLLVEPLRDDVVLVVKQLMGND